MTHSDVKAIVFDIGRVLIEWDPYHLYCKMFDDKKEIAYFLDNVCPPHWNAKLDKGLSWDTALAERIKKYPQYTAQINAYRDRWEEMVPDAIWGTVDIIKQLRAKNYPIYSITNFHHETFKIAAKRFPFLGEFDGIIISGKVGLLKPDPAIYRALLDKYTLKPEHLLFIDDLANNIKAAENIGFKGIVFESPDQLHSRLSAMNIL